MHVTGYVFRNSPTQSRAEPDSDQPRESTPASGKKFVIVTPAHPEVTQRKMGYNAPRDMEGVGGVNSF